MTRQLDKERPAKASAMPLVYLLHDGGASLACLGGWLQSSHWRVESFTRLHAFFYTVQRRPPHAAVIDCRLAPLEGLRVVRRLRDLFGRSVALLVLVSAESEDAVVQAFEAGADDYFVEAAGEAAFRARIRLLLRRVQAPMHAAARARIDHPPYVLDRTMRTATLHGRCCALAPREFTLAWQLFSEPGRLLTKAELLATVWGKDAEVGSATITQHAYLLRRKLALSAHGFSLYSVYGTGYRLDLPGDRHVNSSTIDAAS